MNIMNEFLQSRGLLGSAIEIPKQKTINKSLSVVKQEVPEPAKVGKAEQSAMALLHLAEKIRLGNRRS